MPEPVRATDGQLIRRLTGSRGSTLLVRVHRHLDGTRVTLPPATGTARAALQDAGAVIAAGEELAGRWIFTHCDHKPENRLLADGQVAVLDWDEAGYCHPRLEAVESALQWAGAGQGEPRRDAFRAFLTGYQRHAGQLRPLQRADFAKWVAALAGWFSFTGRRALGDFDDTDAEAAEAARMAIESIGTLRDTLASLDRWVEWLVPC